MCASVVRPCGLLPPLLLLLIGRPLSAAGRQSNCSHPLVPEHGGFRCSPSPCRGFAHKTTIQFFCEPGFHLSRTHLSRCRQGRWQPPVPTCAPLKDSPHMNPDERLSEAVPSMATTAVGVSIFLLTTTACLVVKSRLFPCQSHSRRSSDQLDLMGDALPVSLPSYEEAVYGSWGQRLPSGPAPPGPTQLLLAQEDGGGGPGGGGRQRAADDPDGSQRPLLSAAPGPAQAPPPYEEVQSPRPSERPPPTENKDT